MFVTTIIAAGVLAYLDEEDVALKVTLLGYDNNIIISILTFLSQYTFLLVHLCMTIFLIQYKLLVCVHNRPVLCRRYIK